MTLMKSILLGSAAGIVAVASAQAADLPTRKAASSSRATTPA
jgi:opacity protein-like surface antigen